MRTLSTLLSIGVAVGPAFALPTSLAVNEVQLKGREGSAVLAIPHGTIAAVQHGISLERRLQQWDPKTWADQGEGQLAWVDGSDKPIGIGVGPEVHNGSHAGIGPQKPSPAIQDGSHASTGPKKPSPETHGGSTGGTGTKKPSPQIHAGSNGGTGPKKASP
ncbi:hypothetical protein CF319_g1031 [Tilletia indica]|uniref:Uncharacterized protein n=1 Tax=Tilletia indica TaxID=43049 RepID=A0A177TQH0_9BASI|nr:hypothetical protein CF319_g1031 [Tilletia indica]KAE8258846.1 hypothetical protein A4X13_0g1421 [Tilletia indica]